MSEADSSKPALNLTARDQEIITQALLNIKGGGEIQVDYVGLASSLGLKNANSANAVWGALKKKLYAGKAPAASDDAPSTPAKAKTPRKSKDLTVPSTPKSTKKAAKSADTVSDATDGVEILDKGDASVEVTAPATPTTPTTATPKKRGRKTKAEKEAEAAASKDGAVNGEGEDDKPAKKRKTPVKKSAVVAKTNVTNGTTGDAGTKEAEVSEEDKQAKRVEQQALAAEANEVLTGKKAMTTTETGSDPDPTDSTKQSTTALGETENAIDDDGGESA